MSTFKLLSLTLLLGIMSQCTISELTQDHFGPAKTMDGKCFAECKILEQTKRFKGNLPNWAIRFGKR